jgi:MFS family permease
MIHLDKISWWRVLLSGVIYAVIAQVIHTIGAVLMMSYYMIEEYFPVWSKIMMPNAGPPPASFMVYGIIYALVTGLLFTLVYIKFRDAIPHKGAVKKGLCFGLAVFALAGIPMVLSLHLLINLPLLLILAWGAEALVIYIVNGMIVAKLVK